jgi:hypothetical protein
MDGCMARLHKSFFQARRSDKSKGRMNNPGVDELSLYLPQHKHMVQLPDLILIFT